MSTKRTAHAATPETVLSNAVAKAATLLDLNQATLAKIIGLSTASVSRLYAGTYILSKTRAKEWDFAVLFVRLFRSLDALLGHDNDAKAWLNGHNKGLAAKPIDLIVTTEGLVRVLNYLDAECGRRNIADALAMPGSADVEFNPPRADIDNRPVHLTAILCEECR